MSLLAQVSQAVTQSAGQGLSPGTQAALNHVASISPVQLCQLTLPGVQNLQHYALHGQQQHHHHQGNGAGNPVASVLKTSLKMASDLIEKENTPEAVEKRRKEEAERKAKEAEEGAKKKLEEEERHQRELERRKFTRAESPVSRPEEHQVAAQQSAQKLGDRFANEPAHTPQDKGSNYMELRDMANSLGSNNWWNRQGIQAQRPGVLDPLDAQAVVHMEKNAESSFATHKTDSGAKLDEKMEVEADRKRKMRGSLV